MSQPVYAQHRYYSIHVSETGHTHNRAGADDGETPFVIDCAACEPFLVQMGWVYHPAQVPLTDEQERRKERVTRDGNVALKQFQERLADTAAKAILTGSSDDDDADPAERLEAAKAEVARLEAMVRSSSRRAAAPVATKTVKVAEPTPAAAPKKARRARRRVAVTTA